MSHTKLPTGEQNALGGEMDSVSAIVSGIKPADIPLAAGIDIAQLKQADQDPLEVVVEIPASKSKRGWNYTAQSLKDIVDFTMANTLNGFMGHQKPEDVSTEFVAPATHWVGAEMRGTKAYFRGLIDADAPNLKRWIRTKRIQEVSIFGFPELQHNNSTGEMDVIGYEPLSIDWTPLHRPGMTTKIVGMEMDGVTGEQLDGTFEKLREDLREAAKTYFNVGDGDYVWVKNVRYDDSTAIVEHEQRDTPTKLYSINFAVIDNEVQLGTKTEVIEKKVYEAVGEMQEEGGNENMTFKEIMEKVNNQIKNGQVTYGQVFGEMGVTSDQVAAEMADIKTALEAKDTLDKVTEALGITGEMDIVETAKQGKTAMDESKKEGFAKQLNKAIEEKVSGEMAQGLVRKMLQVQEGATTEEITGEIDRVLADDFVKKVLSSNYVDKGTGTGSGTTQTTTGLVTKKAQI